MSDNTPTSLPESPFDAIKHIDDQGEWWSARELAKLLKYKDYTNFESVIQKAVQACESSGNEVFYHIRDITDMIAIGKGAQRKIKDYRLTRYACYLAAMNADPSKEIVAQAQTYFAVKTRQQERADAHSAAIEEMIARAKARVETREKLTESYDDLEDAAHQQGMRGQRNYAKLHNSGDLGMYTMSKDDLAKRHGLIPQRGECRVNVNNHEGTLEMGATIVRNGLTQADISHMESPENPEMFQANYNAGKRVRDLLKTSGILPEDLPKEPHISEAQKIADGQIPLDMLPSGEDEEE